MFPIELTTYETKPRRAEISTEPLTEENRSQFALCPHVRMPLQHTDVVAVVCQTLHGEVEAQFGDHIVFSADEAYPIKPDELDARYTLAVD